MKNDGGKQRRHGGGEKQWRRSVKMASARVACRNISGGENQ
jgi:hypothetical protein